jgi:hypothetical protein
MSANLLYTKLAADLLQELENIQDDERIGEDNYQRLMAAVLQSFHAVEQVTVQVLTHADKHQHTDSITDSDSENN